MPLTASRAGWRPELRQSSWWMHRCMKMSLRAMQSIRSKKPIARIKAITHRNNAYFQALLTGVPPTENHILKQMPYEASYFTMLKAQHPTLTSVAIPASGGVAFYIVMAMKQRYAGEARHAILTAIASSQRPKLVVVVDPDIDVRNPNQVEWAIAFRSQPARDVIIVDN